jgi:VanZ family protein
MLPFSKIQLKWLACAYTIGIILVSVLPVNSKSPSFPLNSNHLFHIRLDHLVHAIIFIPWVVVIWLVIRFNFRTVPLKATACLALCLLFAAAMEFVQYFLPYRTFSIYDLLANGAGVILGFILLLFFRN